MHSVAEGDPIQRILKKIETLRVVHKSLWNGKN